MLVRKDHMVNGNSDENQLITEIRSKHKSSLSLLCLPQHLINLVISGKKNESKISDSEQRQNQKVSNPSPATSCGEGNGHARLKNY